MAIIRVALPLPIPQLFDYLPHSEQVALTGSRVKVPFGHRKLVGIVVDVLDDVVGGVVADTASNTTPTVHLKPLIAVLDQQPIFSAAVWRLLCWAADYYHHPLGAVLHHVLPKRLRQGKPAVKAPPLCWQLTELGITAALSGQKCTPKQQIALQQLQSGSSCQHQLTAPPITKQFLRALQRKGLVSIAASPPPKLPAGHWPIGKILIGQPPDLNAEQLVAVDSVNRHPPGFIVWLLQGVTGSGKTEVYLRLLGPVLARGEQALLLVPEISLTLQTIAHLRHRLSTPITVLHSALSDNERLAAWMTAASCEVTLVVGTRSALFSPLQRLGLIIVDEEHDLSYKQQNGWRYHARDLAILRAREEGIPIVLGSATPALESLYNVRLGKYQLLTLTQRAGGAQAVRQRLLDLKGQPLCAGISSELLIHMRHHLQAGNQVMLFLNRRGYAPALLCHDCGWLATCQRCERYYTLHHAVCQLHCHHCGSQRPLMPQCATCGSTHLITAGIGTEQLESTLQQLLPHITISRIDRDSTRRKGSLEEHLNAIRNGGAQLLIGTQMLAKGHHFPDVTLVALLNIDSALFSADYRAAERLAQLYTQVAGRAGRASACGEVVLQTHHPQHPLLQTLLSQGYAAFTEQLLQERQEALLPPYVSHALLHAEDFDTQRAEQFLLAARQLIENQTLDDRDLWVLGPSTALLAKRAGYFRWQLLLQHPSRSRLQRLLRANRPLIAALPLANKVRWSLDVDPVEG